MKKKQSAAAKQKESKREILVESLKLPKDMMMGAFMLSMTGNQEAFIENYRGILEYSDTCILLQTKSGQVRFEGTGLIIEYYTNEDMKISGYIQSVIFG
ncbi:MAG: YabP/YqfC family sporulation protein [Lachnospiraceae bacterium]|nr:YabP/YqfC family sporulation protein [Lachnospiraceae bacterium]